MKAINCLIAVLLLLVLSAIISVVISEPSKNFCQEYANNGHKIDFAFRVLEDKTYDKTESNKYFFIGNTYWQLTYSDGSDKTVTIDDLKNTDEFKWLTGKKYSMAWTIQSSKWYFVYPEIIGALQKDMKTIDWWEKSHIITYFLNWKYLSTSTIDFTSNFKPTLAWTPMNITKDYPIVTFMDNNNNNDVKTRVYNFSHHFHPIHTMNTNDQQMFIEGKQEIQINSITKLMAIIRQYSQYDFANGNGGQMGGQGSIVFTNDGDNSSIKYCYVGNPFNETACKPENLKTLIDCSLKTTTTTPKTSSISMTTSISTLTTIPTQTQTNGTINWFKWLKTTLYIVVIVILLIFICLMIYLVYKQWLKRCTK
ncbi:uncharacterized protein LOC128962769 [Oppia nitens]|uniref:uncharacterized protein LOC128962769 n=1 Tax=Oppia nitens TaxID=1686743 RepID=UPI0023DBEC39|nr:uncharacterized protein LOC128962769 [Oppia nitens]